MLRAALRAVCQVLLMQKIARLFRVTQPGVESRRFYSYGNIVRHLHAKLFSGCCRRCARLSRFATFRNGRFFSRPLGSPRTRTLASIREDMTDQSIFSRE